MVGAELDVEPRRRSSRGVQTALSGLTVLGLALIVGCSAWLRWPGFDQGGFASHDVAGILYNAMVIDHGGLPYVDTLELKAPGSFWLATLFAGPEARDIGRFQIAANLWALASLVVVAGLGWRLFGRVSALAAASLYALHDAVLDSMDANYVTWANLPQILAFGVGIEAARTSSARWRPSLWMLAGALAGFAALTKRPDGVVLVALVGMAIVSSPGRRWTRLVEPGWLTLGFGLAHAPLVARYLGAGQLGALVDGYFLNRWGLRYVGARDVDWLASLGDGGLATAYFLGLALVLAGFAGAAGLGRSVAGRRGAATLDAHETAQLRELGFVGAWLVATMFAASLGFRFYKGYFVAVAAPMCLLAAAPMGLLGARCRAHLIPRILVLVLSLGLVGRELLILDKTRADRAQPHDLGGRRIADHLLANTEPDDRIWVWGWHLWDVYPLTGRMSASRVYKPLGVLSQPNDDTWRRPASRLRFVESEYSAMLLADLDAARPAYIVFGSTVPHREFEALHVFLAANYRRDRRVRLGRVEFWRRKDAP